MFRVKIVHYREMVLLQESKKKELEAAAKRMEREIVHLPLLTSTLHGYVTGRGRYFTFPGHR